jgi:biopolymer transport protein TolR
MALSANDAFSLGRRRRRGGRRRTALAEINVTPLVDVMLVLLIIFMISAPLLTAGVPVELPKTEAAAVDDQTLPLSITVKADGTIYVQEGETPFQELSVRLTALAGQGFDKPIFVRADGKAPYAVVAQVMAALSTSGFTKINLITDTGGPSSGAGQVQLPAQPPAPSSH